MNALCTTYISKLGEVIRLYQCEDLVRESNNAYREDLRQKIAAKVEANLVTFRGLCAVHLARANETFRVNFTAYWVTQFNNRAAYTDDSLRHSFAQRSADHKRDYDNLLAAAL